MPTPRAATLIRPSSRPPWRVDEALTLDAAEEAIGGNGDALKRDLDGIDTLVAELAELGPGHVAVLVLVHQEQGHPGVAGLGVGVGLDQEGQAVPCRRW